MELGITIDIDAPVQAVWQVWTDIDRWPEWTPSVSQVSLLTPGPFGPGSQVRIRQPRLPVALWRVTDLHTQRGFVWVSTRPGARVSAYHRLDPLPGGTRAVLGLAFEGPLGIAAGWLTRSIAHRYLAMEAAGLKARSEAVPFAMSPVVPA